MKVDILYIDPSEEEAAKLHIKKGHRSLSELVRVITEETYKEIFLKVTSDGNQYQINCKHICYIESLNEKAVVHTNLKTFLCKKKLYELEELLSENFARISKGVILNLVKVEYYSPQMNGIMKAVLSNGKEVYISRKYLKGLRYKIGGK